MAGLELDSRTLRVLLGLILRRPSNFSWLREGKIAGSGLPVGERGYRWLREHGISTIITLTEEGLDQAALHRNGITNIQIPLVNRTAATPEVLSRITDTMVSELKQGKSILVHCQAGQGRTGMVLAAYLIKEEGLSADEAIREVQRLRPGSLKRDGQRLAVMAYERYLRPAPDEQVS
jgi:atypical dual specificity phosphatase